MRAGAIDVLATPAPPRSARFTLGSVAVGVIVGVVAVVATDQATKSLVKVAGAVILLIGAVLSGRPRHVLLFLWAASLPYYRSYFLSGFEEHGSYGPFWGPADVFLAALLGLWAYEAIVLKRRRAPIGGPALLWFLPFAVACALSAITADRPEWTAFEMARIVRVGLIVAYVRYNVGRSEWWTCVAGVGAAILLQAFLAVVFLASGHQIGFSSFLGVGSGIQGLEHLTADLSSSYSYRRGQGTVGHSNTLALYLLLVAPVFLTLAFSARHRRLRLLCAVVGLAGWVGVAATLSRAGWAIALLEGVVLATLLPMLGLVDVRRILGALCLAGFAAVLTLALFAERIEGRIRGDLREALDFRRRHSAIAIELWERHPLTGVGLNNYSDNLREYGLEEVNSMLELQKEAREALQLRFTAWVHNMYLLVLAETGLVGLGTYLLAIGAALVLAVRTIAATRGRWRAVSVGLGAGMLGVHLFGFSEAALWIDPATYTFALVTALLNNVRPLAAAEGAVHFRVRAPWQASLREISA